MAPSPGAPQVLVQAHTWLALAHDAGQRRLAHLEFAHAIRAVQLQ